MKGPEYGDLPKVIIKETEAERAKRIELEAQEAREKRQREAQTMVRRVTPEMQKRIDAANAADQFPAPLLSTDEVPQSLGFYESAKPMPIRPRQSSKVGYIIGGISGALAVAAALAIATVSNRQKVQPSLSNNNPVPAETVAAVTTATNASVATVAPVETNNVPTEPTSEPSAEVDSPADIPTAKPSAKPVPSITGKTWPKPPAKPKGDGIMREVPF